MKVKYLESNIIVQESWIGNILMKVTGTLACLALVLVLTHSKYNALGGYIFSIVMEGIILTIPRKKFIINSEGITIKFYKRKLILWNNIKYISKKSIAQKNAIERINNTSDKDRKNMDGQEYEEIEAQASKPEEGIYIGVLNGDCIDEDVIWCQNKIKDKLYDKIIEICKKA